MIDIEKEYQEALDYLYSFIDYSLTRSFRYTPEKFDLGRMVSFMELLGNPQKDFQVIHVAGTKGKGSVSALMANALETAGYKVGFYTSPHLHDYCERIKVNRQPIAHETFVETINKIKPQIEQAPGISTFELTTAIGFLYFSQMKVDIAVIEVGLGGRLDATNIVNPLVSVITSLSLDHVNVLGDTLAKIAYEKAGIIKEGKPVVLAPQKEEARRVVERIAEERHAPLTQVGRDVFFAPHSRSLSGQSFFLWSAEEQEYIAEYMAANGGEDWEPIKLEIPLLGYHQIENAATAYAGLQVARQSGLNISAEAIQKGFAGVEWPGRFEVFRKSPPIIVDSAHNQDSALRLRLAIDDYLTGKPVILVFGASEDKDIRGMFKELLPRVECVIATQSIHPRAIDADILVNMAYQFGCQAKAVVPIENAIKTALEMAGKESAVVVAGSIFIAAAAREVLFQLSEEIHLDNWIGKSHIANKKDAG
ncbi:MAG: bifunctional folylpolyglutamate synthase/dihydrofolate synthase [Chloroflexi bacterium]|nr:bifunctional folylpolyglutamate synthase/dihydrofolate synthase [Chloroflexota bacterium]